MSATFFSIAGFGHCPQNFQGDAAMVRNLPTQRLKPFTLA
jgi:hypothetical protein